jgi:ABC-type lipoprotein export system ATPase subunit
MVTHDMDLAQRATRTVLLVDGEIVDGQVSASELKALGMENKPKSENPGPELEAPHA